MILRDLKQGSDEWREWRGEGLGGSDVGPILLGDNWHHKDSHRDILLAEKITGRRLDSPNWAMRRGAKMEPQIRFAYQNLIGREAPPACVVHDGEPWMRASLDGLPFSVHWLMEGKAPCVEDHNWAVAGRVPPHYRPQCQWQLLVSEGDGVRVCDYCSLSAARETFRREADLFAVVTVRPDLEMQAELRRKCREFWMLVLAGRKELAK